MPGVAQGRRADLELLVSDMILKVIYLRGTLIGRDLGQYLCLPFKVIRESIKFLKDEKQIEIMGGDLVGEVSYKFSLTDVGRQQGHWLRSDGRCAVTSGPPRCRSRTTSNNATGRPSRGLWVLA